MSDDSQRPIVIKRVKKGGGGHHGGAWKIAYADFVTAMMAFFLLMWLLGSTTQGDLKGIAQYFKTPLKIALFGGKGSGDSASIIHGGGRDLTKTSGQVKMGEIEVKHKRINLLDAKAVLAKEEAQKLKTLKSDLEKAIDSNPEMKKFKNQLLIDITSEGLRIQIVDEKNRPMFAMGSTVLQPYAKAILDEIGKTLNSVPNRISLSGHTDASPYSGGGKNYSNWELSADRANASRRELIRGGMDGSKVLRVVGLASAVPIDTSNPYNPINRRISIIVMNKKTEDAITQSEGVVNVNKKTDVTKQTVTPAAPKKQ